jgi:squalene-hopene/tetraprenyl-beta-curcumene cyclase
MRLRCLTMMGPGFILGFLGLIGPLAGSCRANDESLGPGPNSPDEPIASAWSLARAGEFLDAVALRWTRQRQCGTCHTNYAYMLARPLLGDGPSAASKEIREFFEQRVANWDSGEESDKPRWDTEVVATAAALAIHDAETTGKLHPLTRRALDRMWTLQHEDGSWDWLKCGWPPYEHDDYYGATFAALGVGLAPDDYRQTEPARKGLEKLRDYFQNHPAPSLHHRAMLLWASQRVEGLMSASEREQTIHALLALQRPDGGWNLPSLGDWNRRDGTPNDKNTPSDGFATGFVVYVLRQAGLPTEHEALQRGVSWLKSHQRVSGRWFTRSLNNDKHHYITHAGTAFAVMAIQACANREGRKEGL